MYLRPITAIIASLAFAGVATWAAEPDETIVLADGSVYMGRKSEQNLEEETCFFRYDSAMVIVPAEGVSSVKLTPTKFDSLTEAWQKWFSAHPYFIHTDSAGVRTVNLHQLNGDKTPVFLQSQTPEKYTYVTMSQGDLRSLPMNDIVKNSYKHRDALDISGVVTEIRLLNGRVLRGQLIEDSAEGLGVLTENDVVEFVSPIDIVTRLILPLDKDADLATQVPFLDKLVVRGSDGNNLIHEGVITEIYYGADGESDPYVVLYDPYKTDEPVIIEYTSILKKSKVRNKSCDLRREVVFENEDAIVAAGKEIAPAPFLLDKQTFRLETNKNKIDIAEVKATDGKLTVSLKLPSDVKDPDLIPVELKSNKYEFGYDTLHKIGESVKPYLSPRGTSSYTYSVEPGKTYVLYCSDSQIYIFRVSDAE